MKSRLLVRSFAAFLAVAACSLSASATELALTADAHVSASRATSNFGNIANLYVGNGNTALLEFDLNSLPAGTTPNQISHATLTLFINRVNASGAVGLAPVNGAWSESGVTYATLPPLGSTGNSFTASLAGQYVTLDVTALVQAWVSNPSSNNGVALSSATANVLLDSKENDQTAHPARLDVTLTSMGATGATGAQGLQGVPGAQGAQGMQGLQGLPGATGAQGLQGLQGNQGATGSTGATGAQGATGMTGATGAAGANGVTGMTGVAGATGAQGTTGATGATGAQGATGSTVGGNYSSAATYFPGSVVVYGGQTYLGITSNSGITPGTDPATWSLVSGAGTSGPTGATGATGQQGLMGLQGATGATGQQGPQGATGATGIQGNAGATGATGAMGATGVIGATGAQGQQGAVGTTGAIGQQGVAGATGANGATGATGVSYTGAYSSSTTYTAPDVVLYNNALYIASYNGAFTGVPPTNSSYWSLLLPQGATGVTGATGADSTVAGPQGPTGATGPVGSTGAQGPSGSQGPAGPGGSAQASAWDSGISYVAGQLVTYSGQLFLAQQASTNVQPGSTAAAGTWSPYVSATGTAPFGIPYTTSNHLVSTSYATYPNLTVTATNTTTPTYLDTTTVFASAAAPCTPYATIYNPTPNSFTFYVYPVTFSGITITMGSTPLLTIVVGANGTYSAAGSTPISTTQMLLGSTPQLTGGAPGYYGLAFSCQ